MHKEGTLATVAVALTDGTSHVHWEADQPEERSNASPLELPFPSTALNLLPPSRSLLLCLAELESDAYDLSRTSHTSSAVLQRFWRVPEHGLGMA